LFPRPTFFLDIPLPRSFPFLLSPFSLPSSITLFLFQHRCGKSRATHAPIFSQRQRMGGGPDLSRSNKPPCLTSTQASQYQPQSAY
jgi:hypothetical protein